MNTPVSLEGLRELVQTAVDSYEKLFILRALAEAGQAAAADTLAEHLSSDHHLVREALVELAQAGLVVIRDPGCYAYRPQEPTRERSIRALFALLEEEPIELARLMDRAALARARSSLDARVASSYLALSRVRHRGPR